MPGSWRSEQPLAGTAPQHSLPPLGPVSPECPVGLGLHLPWAARVTRPHPLRDPLPSSWHCGSPFDPLEALQGGLQEYRPQARPGAGSSVVPTLHGANLGSPALPHPCLAATRAPRMWLWIPSPGATDSCLSGRGRRTAFRPLIPANSREPGAPRPCQPGHRGGPGWGRRPRQGQVSNPSSQGAPEFLTPLLPAVWWCWHLTWGLRSAPRLQPVTLGHQPLPSLYRPGVQRPPSSLPAGSCPAPLPPSGPSRRLTHLETPGVPDADQGVGPPGIRRDLRMSWAPPLMAKEPVLAAAGQQIPGAPKCACFLPPSL